LLIRALALCPSTGKPLRYTGTMKTLADYTVVVMPDSGGYVAYVPAIPGCHALGDTPDEARAELDGVFQMFADDYATSGEAMPPDVKELVAVAGYGKRATGRRPAKRVSVPTPDWESRAP
jgi:predicted RNase H-like HicB family nuclease